MEPVSARPEFVASVIWVALDQLAIDVISCAPAAPAPEIEIGLPISPAVNAAPATVSAVELLAIVTDALIATPSAAVPNHLTFNPPESSSCHQLEAESWIAIGPDAVPATHGAPSDVRNRV